MKNITTFVLFLVFIMAITGCQKNSDTSESAGMSVPEHFLSCTVQDASAFDDTYQQIISVQTGSESEMVSMNGMEAYFQERFGDDLTAECIESMMADRSIASVIQMVKECGADVAAEDIQMKKRSSEENAYDFEAKIITAADKKPIAAATGYVKLVSDQSAWKASVINVDVKEEK